MSKKAKFILRGVPLAVYNTLSCPSQDKCKGRAGFQHQGRNVAVGPEQSAAEGRSSQAPPFLCVSSLPSKSQPLLLALFMFSEAHVFRMGSDRGTLPCCGPHSCPHPHSPSFPPGFATLGHFHSPVS